MSDADPSKDRSFTDAELRCVYDIAAQFGPERAIPVPVRAREKLPHLNDGQISAAIDRVAAIENRAWTLAESVWDEKLSQDAARSQLAREYPELGGERASRAMGQAMYYVMR